MNQVTIYNIMKEEFDTYVRHVGYPRSRAAIENVFGHIATKIADESEKELSVIRTANESVHVCKCGGNCKTKKEESFTCTCPTCQTVKAAIRERLDIVEPDHVEEKQKPEDTSKDFCYDDETQQQLFSNTTRIPSVVIRLKNSKSGAMNIYHVDSEVIKRIPISDERNVVACYLLPFVASKVLKHSEQMIEYDGPHLLAWVVTAYKDGYKKVGLYACHEGYSGIRSWNIIPERIEAEAIFTYIDGYPDNTDVVNITEKLGIFPNTIGTVSATPKATKIINRHSAEILYDVFKDVFDDIGVNKERLFEFLEEPNTEEKEGE